MRSRSSAAIWRWTRYEKPGVSLVDVRIQDSRVHLSRMRQIGSGYQPMDEDTLVCNEEVSKDPLDGIATLNDSAKGRLYCVKLDAGKTARSMFRSRWQQKKMM